MLKQHVLPSSSSAHRARAAPQPAGRPQLSSVRRTRVPLAVVAQASRPDDSSEPCSSSSGASSSTGRQIANQAVQASVAGASVTAVISSLLTSFGGPGGPGSGGSGGDGGDGGGSHWGSEPHGPLCDLAEAAAAVAEDEEDEEDLSELPTEEQKVAATEHGVDGKELITSEYPEELWEQAGPDNRIGNKKCVEVVIEGWPEAGALPKLVSSLLQSSSARMAAAAFQGHNSALSPLGSAIASTVLICMHYVCTLFGFCEQCAGLVFLYACNQQFFIFHGFMTACRCYFAERAEGYAEHPGGLYL